MGSTIRILKVMDGGLTRVGVVITNAVGTMWCALAFTALALVSLPQVIHTGNVTALISWIAQTFLQLVLLSIIMVGQRVQSERTDKLEDAHQHTHRLLHELHEHTVRRST